MLGNRIIEQAAKITSLAERHSAPRRVVHDPWARVLGQIALFTFVVVMVSGVVLAFWFTPSMSQVVYDGGYAPLRGAMMSEAYASTLDISFQVRGGLLVRQIHQWGTLVLVAAMSLYMLRIFFTGAFRQRGMVNWLLILALLVVGMIDAYLGHLIPDDLLSGTSLRVIEGIMLAIPIVGTALAGLLFGGEFPGSDIISRLYAAHVLIPTVITVAVVAVYVLNRRRRGARAIPRIRSAAKNSGLMLVVSGVIVVMAATIQVNPVWLWGPFEPAQASAGSQPPWYMGFLDGAVRLMPAWDIHILGHELTLSLIVPALVIPGLLLGALAAYPLVERWAFASDDVASEGLDRPRDMPVRTGLGAGFITFYLVLWIAAGNDVIAQVLHVPVNGVTRFLQVGVFVLPPLAFWATKRICLGLLLRERDDATEGRETGIIMVDVNGGFSELHAPLSDFAMRELTAHGHPQLIDPGSPTDANGVSNPAYGTDLRRAQLSRFYFADLPGGE